VHKVRTPSSHGSSKLRPGEQTKKKERGGLRTLLAPARRKEGSYLLVEENVGLIFKVLTRKKAQGGL